MGLFKGVRTKSFISEISLSTSSINWIIKSTSLCFNMASVWKFVIRNEISYPYNELILGIPAMLQMLQ